MGYFNYFIKCIIKNIAYRITRPKVMLKLFFICILSFITFLFLRTTGYCADWTDAEIEACLSGLSDITNNQGVLISQLSSMGVDVSDIENTLNSVKTDLSAIRTYSSNINSVLTDIFLRVNSLNTTLTEMAQQQNLYFEDFSEELRTIRDALVGSDDTPFTAEYLGIVNASSSSGYTPGLRKYKIPMIKNYTYKIQITYTNNESSAIGVYYMLSGLNVDTGGVAADAGLVRLGTVPANSSAMFTITTRDYTKPYLYLTYGYNSISVSGTCSIEGIVDILDRTNQQVVDNIQQGNQLQQEQNEILTDDNVDTDGLEFATDDTVNPTSEGFDTLFNTVYNAFCTTTSEPLTITLPFINKTFTIQPNVVSNGMQKAGLGVIVTLINSFYYFSVCLFIYKDINKIVENLKSGNITSDCGNVKTEVL